MPYINQTERSEFDPEIFELAQTLIYSDPNAIAGSLNYIISKLLHEYIVKTEGPNYNQINMIIGVLNCVQLEFYRRVASPYEDKKITQNGDISPLIDRGQTFQQLRKELEPNA